MNWRFDPVNDEVEVESNIFFGPHEIGDLCHIRNADVARLENERDALQAEKSRAMNIGHLILAKLPKARRLFDDTVADVVSIEEMMTLLMQVCAEPDEEAP